MSNEPGRALNALVAERVFGWRWATNSHGHEGWASNGADGGIVKSGETWGGFWVSPDTPAYSTDIAVAWQVVEAMIKRGVWLDSLEGKWENSWRASFATRETGYGLRHYQAMADTAPHAICLAALKAMEAPDAHP